MRSERSPSAAPTAPPAGPETRISAACAATGLGGTAGNDILISGDGGFLFTATEMATAVHHRIPLVAVVFNDSAYGNVRRIQQERFGVERTIASTLVNPDIVAFAKSFGCLGLRAYGPHELGDALRTAMAHDGPVVIEVPVGQVPSPWPFIVMPRSR